MTLMWTRTCQATPVADDARAMPMHMRSHPACISAHVLGWRHTGRQAPHPCRATHTGQQGLIAMHMMSAYEILNPIPLYCALYGAHHATSPRSGVKRQINNRIINELSYEFT